ncbi:hypothetical protein [Phaeodactylibacter xiamenensis]|uniref:hypothetical protein n=1 Tax=Phaeodactylibacter xiamenensis TaxID=1524460 RepID=UPI0024A90590|nr:hypothetical protein [Phaeodactylibacter xiamenensis]
MKHLLSALFLCLAVTAFGQFRMVSNGIPSWTVVDDSTYTATVNFQSDQTGFGYLANAIADTFRLFTGTEQLYRVSAVANTTFSSADLTVIEVSNQYTTTNGAPTGQVMVFNPDGRETIPQNPFGSTGSTAQIQAAIDTYNARVRAAADAGGGLTYTGIVYDTLTSGTVTVTFTYEGGAGATLSNPAAGEYTIAPLKGTHLHEVSVFGNNTTLNASQEMIIRINNTDNGAARRVSVQLYDANNSSLVDQQITATVHTQTVSGTLTTVTVPGLNGFGATGYLIELR